MKPLPGDPALPATLSAPLPRLSQARVELTRAATIVDAEGQRRAIRIPLERALTIYVDRGEVVTLMTLGQYPEWLVLGYLLNQRLIADARELDSITVDWDTGAAAARSRAGLPDLGARLGRRVVTTGCGQGTVFGDVLSAAEGLVLPPPRASGVAVAAVIGALEVVRSLPSVHREAGSVHGTALLRGSELLFHVEDVGRHNAVDKVVGWALRQGRVPLPDTVLFVSGRASFELVQKAVLAGIGIVAAVSAPSSLAVELAERSGLTLVGFLRDHSMNVYTHPQRVA